MFDTDETKTVEKVQAITSMINNIEDIYIYIESDINDKTLIIKELCGISRLKGKTVIPNYQEPFGILADYKNSLNITNQTLALKSSSRIVKGG